MSHSFIKVEKYVAMPKLQQEFVRLGVNGGICPAYDGIGGQRKPVKEKRVRMDTEV